MTIAIPAAETIIGIIQAEIDCTPAARTIVVSIGVNEPATTKHSGIGSGGSQILVCRSHVSIVHTSESSQSESLAQHPGNEGPGIQTLVTISHTSGVHASKNPQSESLAQHPGNEGPGSQILTIRLHTSGVHASKNPQSELLAQHPGKFPWSTHTPASQPTIIHATVGEQSEETLHSPPTVLPAKAD